LIGKSKSARYPYFDFFDAGRNTGTSGGAETGIAQVGFVGVWNPLPGNQFTQRIRRIPFARAQPLVSVSMTHRSLSSIEQMRTTAHSEGFLANVNLLYRTSIVWAVKPFEKSVPIQK